MSWVSRITGISITFLGVFFVVLGLTNSLIGLPELIVQPLCPADVSNDGYVDWDEFVNEDCVTAVKTSSEQALPYFQLIDSLIIISGIGLLIIAWILGISRRRKLELKNYGGRRISGRLEGQYQGPVGGNVPLDFSDHSHLFDEQPNANFINQQTQQPQTQQPQSSDEVGFRNPFDF